jgi:type III secretion protein Q
MERINTQHPGSSRATSVTPAGFVTALDLARVPAVSAHVARQSRIAVDERLRTMLTHTLGVSGWSVGTRSPLHAERAATLHLRWGLEAATVALDLTQHPLIASVVRSQDGNAHGGASLRTAVASILLAPLLDAFARLGMDGAEVIAVEPGFAGRDGAECCALAFRISDRRIDAVLDKVSAGWLDAFERLVARQCTPFATHVSEIAVPGRLLVGERSIDITTLASLQPGDVILRAVSPAAQAFFTRREPSVTLPLVWGRYGTRQLRAFVAIDNHALTLTEDPHMSHDTHFSAPLTDSVDTPVEISHLDLPLKLEIDTVSLPVAQLSALRAGYVLELPTSPLDARIRLVSYGQTIGFGELVSVGDHLGVRLVQLSHAHGSV